MISLQNIKHFLVNIFAILFFLIANQSVFANNYGQEYGNGILQTGNYAENVNFFLGENGKAPFNIPVQRFGLMKTNGLNHFSPRIGSSKFLNRTFNAIKPEFNELNLFTKGTIPKGTPIKFGIVGPQGLKYPGGNIQILTNPKNVLNQTSKLIK